MIRRAIVDKGIRRRKSCTNEARWRGDEQKGRSDGCSLFFRIDSILGTSRSSAAVGVIGKSIGRKEVEKEQSF